MKKTILLLFLTLFIQGCTSLPPTVPKGFTGPTTRILDTAKSIDSGKADFFYLSHIDGQKVDNSLYRSLSASYGKGNYLEFILHDSLIPAEKHVFTIEGRTVYAMPIRALAGTVYHIKGDVTFTPITNEDYVIRGKLSEENSSVWIEKKSDGSIVQKFEVKGESKLGFFEK